MAHNGTRTDGPSVFNLTESPVMMPAAEDAEDDIFVLSDQQFATAESILEPLKYIAFALAVPLALCNIFIFTRKDMRSASATYVIALNLGQMTYVVLNIVDDIWVKFEPPNTSLAYCISELYLAASFGVLMAKRGSYLILCLACVERLYAVIRPLHIKNFILSKRPVICVVIAYLITWLLHLTQLGSFTVVEVVLPSGQIGCRIRYTDFYLKNKETFFAINTAWKTLFSDVMLVVQLVLNALIVVFLRRHKVATRHIQTSADEDAKRRQERQLTVTLLGAAFSYLIFSIPSLIFNIVISVSAEFGPFGKYSKLYLVTVYFMFTMSILACGVDFFFYLALSSKFRSTILRLLGRKMQEKQGQLVTVENQTVEEDVSMPVAGTKGTSP